MNEFIEQFLLESRELVQQATDDLLILEKAPADNERLDSVFRAFHTLKGGAGIVEFAAMQRAVHAAEGALQAARSGPHRVTPRLVGDCLTCLDQVIQWLDAMQSDGKLPVGAVAQARLIVERFERSIDETKGSVVMHGSTTPVDWSQTFLANHSTLRGRASTAIRYTPDTDCFFRGEDPIERVAMLPGLLCLEVDPAEPWPALDALDPFSCNLVLKALTESSAPEVATALRDLAGQCEVQAIGVHETGDVHPLLRRAKDVLQAQVLLLGQGDLDGAIGRLASAGIAAANVLRHLRKDLEADRIAEATSKALIANSPDPLRTAIEASLKEIVPDPGAVSLPQISQDRVTRTLRVDAARIDALVRLTGELTVAKNAIGHASKLAQEGRNPLAPMLKERHAVLDRLVGELQRSVLGMRVLPLRHVFQRFPRLVREMSADLGKPATLKTEGDDTEADKVVVEMLFEPLMHVLRNAIDHGIEDAATRAAQGKPPTAILRLRAIRQGEHVLIEVSDDGRGIDVPRVREVARERKVVPEETLAAMSDVETMDLIFAPGFSTATEVTELSGRGVGLDAVRTAVERLAGRVSVESRAGEGTTMRFRLPFSVMMTRVLTVEAGGQLFGIPLDAVVETVRVGVDSIVPVGAAKAVVLRNRTIPLVELAGALGIQRERSTEKEATVVVARIDGDLGALHVDRLRDQMEIILKPLDGLLSGMSGVAGSTLLGDGSVLLILDIGALLQ